MLSGSRGGNNSNSNSNGNSGPVNSSRIADPHPETKLGAGRESLVQTNYEFQAADTVPFDVDALYNYLTVQAEQRACGTADEVVALFEAEFAASGAVPHRVTTTIEDRLVETNMDTVPAGDDLKRDALITFFVDEYSHAFAASPNDLPDPRGVPLTHAPAQDGFLSSLYSRFRSLLARQ
jgi:hypothetical protein